MATMSAKSQLRQLFLPAHITDAGESSTSHQRTTPAALLCPHAVAYGSLVIGVHHNEQQIAEELEESSRNQQQWWTWKVSFSPLQVTSVLSNDEGTIVVVVTSGGTVSVLRGSDGVILKTRQVALNALYEVSCCATWIRGGRAYAQGKKDALLLTVTKPIAQFASVKGRRLNRQQQPDLFLISNINGITHNHPSVSKNTAKVNHDLYVQAIPCNEENCDFCVINGVHKNANEIRFVAANREGEIHAYDYSIENKLLSKVAVEMDFGSPDWRIDSNVPFLIQELLGKTDKYMVCCAHSSKETAIVWLDVNQMTEACRFVLPDHSGTKPKLFALTSVKTFSANSCLAVAFVAEFPDSGKVKAMVVQVVVEETLGLMNVSRPHVVYEIELEMKSVLSADVAGVGDDCSPNYSFRYTLRSSQGDITFFEFLPSSISTFIGDLRYMLESWRFALADEILSIISLETMSSDPYGSFHSSEIWFALLHYDLQHQRLQDCKMVNETLIELASGAALGKARAFDCLIKVSSLLAYSTHAEQSSPASLEDLSTLILLMKGIKGTIPASFETVLSRQIMELEGRLAVLQFLSECHDATYVAKWATDQNTVSPLAFFCFLMTNRHFDLAKRLFIKRFYRSRQATIMSPSPIVKVLSLTPNEILSSELEKDDDEECLLLTPTTTQRAEVLPLSPNAILRSELEIDVDDVDDKCLLLTAPPLQPRTFQDKESGAVLAPPEFASHGDLNVDDKRLLCASRSLRSNNVLQEWDPNTSFKRAN